MYDTGHAPLPGLKSMEAALSGKTSAHNPLMSDNDGDVADGAFSTKLSAARKRLSDGTESRADGEKKTVDEASKPGSGDAVDADYVVNPGEKTSRPDAPDTDKDVRLFASRESLSAGAVAEDMPALNPAAVSEDTLALNSAAVSEDTSELNPTAAQAENKSMIKPKNGLETDVQIPQVDQPDTGVVTTTQAGAHAHDSRVADTEGLPAAVQRRQESEPEGLAGLLSGKDDSVRRGKDTVNLQPLPVVGSKETPDQIGPDQANRIKVVDTTVGPVPGLPESDGVNAGVLVAGLNLPKSLSANTRLHTDRNLNGKSATELTLTERPAFVVSQLGKAISVDTEGNALPQQTAANLVADSQLRAVPGNTSPDETIESAQVIAAVKRAALTTDGTEKNVVAMKTEAPGNPVQTEGTKAGFNVEEMLFQRSLSTHHASAASSTLNSDSGLHQSNSSVNMFHTFGSGILTAPVTARGLPEAGAMMTAPTTVSLLGENAGNDLAGNIRWMKSEGVKSAVINVSPSGMGPISVRIGIEDETMNVSFVALQGATRDALDSALPRLRDQLLSQGNESVRVDVSDGKSGQNRSGADGQLAENRHNQSNDDGAYSVGNRSEVYGEKTSDVDEPNMISSNDLPGEHLGTHPVRYDLYV